MTLESHCQQQLATYSSCKRWVVGYSGGLDSTVLLNLMSKVADRPVVALHVNHHLSARSDCWQNQCAQYAEQLGISFYAESVMVETSGFGLEAAARDLRYRVFTRFLQDGDILLLAHHRDDQAETFLLRLLRGAGVLGLSAMKAERELKHGLVVRPLLEISRSELEAYAHQQQLHWVEDESNDSLRYDRNYLRHQIMPRLSERWPQVQKKLSQCAERLQQAQGLLNELATMDLVDVGMRQERVGYSVDWRKLNVLGCERINNLLRYWCISLAYPLPDSQHLRQIQQQFFSSNAMLTKAVVQWSTCELRQYHYRLFLMPRLTIFTAKNIVYEWDKPLQNPCDLGDYGTLSLINAPTLGLAKEYVINHKVVVKWRRGGERCTPSDRTKPQTLKKLLQEYKLETWLRDRVPLIFIDDQLAAVGDLWVCKQFIAKSEEDSVSFHWSVN